MSNSQDASYTKAYTREEIQVQLSFNLVYIATLQKMYFTGALTRIQAIND